MFGSIWCESQEPVVKKRRRRSGMIGLLAPQVMEPALEEDAKEFQNNDNVNLAEISRKQIEMKLGDTTVNKNTGIIISNETKVDTVNTVAYCQTENVHDAMATKVIEKTGELEWSLAVEVKNALSPKLSEVGECEVTNGINTSLNTSNFSSESLANCNMSKDSPDSMSPDFPLSPNTAIYHDANEDSFLEISTKRERVSDKNGLETPMHSLDLSADSVSEMKLPGADNVSDLSHSDKENSIINDNTCTHLDVTPKLTDESAKKVSPGFLSICKTFAGKVVNFVKTSPSFLTGAVTDSATASPALKGNTSLNQVSNELSDTENSCDKEDAGLGKERNHLESDMYARNLCESTCTEIDEISDGQNIVVDMSTKISKSANSVIFGSARKKRDRKSFIDTFNAVSNELKKDRRKSCSDDGSENLKGKPVCPNLTSEQAEEISIVCEKSKMGIYIEKEVPAESALENFIESDNHNADSVMDDIHVCGVGNTENIESIAPVSYEDAEQLQKDEQNLNSTCAAGLDCRTCSEDVIENINLIGEKSSEVSTSETTDANMDIDCFTTKSKDVGNSLGLNGISESKNEKILPDEEMIEDIDGKEVEKSQETLITVCMNDRSQQKHKTKRQKRRAIDIPTVEDSETAFDFSAERYTESSENKNLHEKKQKLSFEFDTDGQNEMKNKERKERKLIKNKSFIKADTTSVTNDKILINAKQQTTKNKISINNDDERSSTTKTRKDRRKSFGFLSVSASDKEESNKTERNSVTKSFESEIETVTIEKETSLQKDIEGHHKFCEKVDNRMESAVTVDGFSETVQGLQPNEKMRKKRGRPRKSVNLQDLLEKNIPKTGLFHVVNTEGNENQNVSELTNEISQVQICDTSKELSAIETETFEERANPPVECVISGEQKIEPDHKYHISVEVESSNIQITDTLNSPSVTDSSKTYQNLPRRQKNAPRKPRSNIIEKTIVEEDPVNPDGTENKNVSELTNEISQVQINDTDTEIKSVETPITVENLILPDDYVTSQNQERELKRKRRRSAEAASLKLQMINLDESPSNNNPMTVVQDKRRRRKSADAATLKIQAGLDNQEESSPSPDCTSTVTKFGRKRKRMEESLEDLEKIYRNKNFVKPEEKKPWQTVMESPDNSVEVFGKKRLQRHIEFERPTQMKLRRRLQKAVKNGWDPKKRKKSELADDFVQKKLENLWSELDQAEEDPNSLQNKLKRIVETI